MLKGLYTAYTGMVNEQNRMDVLTNNLANSATTGFKKEGSTSQTFKDVLAYKIKDSSENPNLARRIGINTPGVKIGENYTDYEQGAFKMTNNPLDIAIGGEGFFNIEFTNKAGETSTKYTRDGSFTMDKEGYVVTKDGDFVLGAGGKIKLDPLQAVAVDQTGAITQAGKKVAQLEITDFEDYDYLEHYGENMYQAVEGATMKKSDTVVFGGYLEASNVQVVSEMVEMMTVTRAYESSQRLIQTHDSTLDKTVNQIGRL
ncbi:MAG: flagellar hook-basal body protein [Lachnospiraceae bacterium]